MDSDVEARLLALEERVAALEAAAPAPDGTAPDGAAAVVGSAEDQMPPAPAADAPAGEAGGVFWALDGLKARIPDPGAVLFTGAVAGPGGERYEYQYGLDTAHLFDLDWASFAEPLAALGHPLRLAILRAVAGGTETVAGLVEELDAGTAGQIYHHVNQLAARGWLAAHARSRYRIPPARMIPLLAVLTAAQAGS